MDGVIVDSEPLSMRTIAEIAAERGIHLEPALLHELTGVSLERVLEVVGARLGGPAGAAGPATLIVSSLDELDVAALERLLRGAACGSFRPALFAARFPGRPGAARADPRARGR